MKHVALITARIEQTPEGHKLTVLETEPPMVFDLSEQDESAAIASVRGLLASNLGEHEAKAPVLYEPERQKEPDGATFDKDIGPALERAMIRGESTTIAADTIDDENEDNEAGTPE